MHQPVAELAHRRQVVHLLPDEVRGVEVESEGQAGDVGIHPPPDGGGGGEVLPPGPFIAGEEHRAVFDADAHAPFFGLRDQGLPHLQEAGPVVIDRAGPVAAHERVDAGHPQQRGGINQPVEVLDGRAGDVGIGIERIGIVPQSADLDPRLPNRVENLGGLGGREVNNVDMGHPGIPAFGLRHRPAHQFDAVVPGRGGELADFGQRELRENRTDKTQLHHRNTSPLGAQRAKSKTKGSRRQRKSGPFSPRGCLREMAPLSHSRGRGAIGHPVVARNGSPG